MKEFIVSGGSTVTLPDGCDDHFKRGDILTIKGSDRSNGKYKVISRNESSNDLTVEELWSLYKMYRDIKNWLKFVPRKWRKFLGKITGRITGDDLWELSSNSTTNLVEENGGPKWWDYEIYAITKKDTIMSVWNGSHPENQNTVKHVCPAGTRVRIWMVSRMGDAGITDNLKDPIGYDCRGIDVDKDLKNVEMIKNKK